MALTLSLSAVACASRPISRESDAGIGFTSPSAAMASLRARPDVTFGLSGDWVVASDRVHDTMWAFPPHSDPTYPTVVKRTLVKTGDAFGVETRILCGGQKVACDALPAKYRKLDADMRDYIAAHKANQVTPKGI